MAQWVNKTGTKPDNLDLILEIHMVESEPTPTSDPLTSAHMCMQVHQVKMGKFQK